MNSKGRDVLGKCVESKRKVAKKYFGKLPEEDLENLIEIYEKVYLLCVRKVKVTCKC